MMPDRVGPLGGGVSLASLYLYSVFMNPEGTQRCALVRTRPTETNEMKSSS